ncbi:MAG: PadR family transcriptional regulator [Microbacterium sp.]|uniref:PadR family transcriptional regulator n=1 Tax=Microbacterium sp. TaxID=51671 RepID=UPI0039E55605
MVPDLVLAALLDGPAHGYELMDRLEQSSGGTWRPSPGSVYPLLQMFEEKGYVRSSAARGRRRFALTDEGRAYADERGVEAVVESFHIDSPHLDLRAEMQQVHSAVRQISSAGTNEQIDLAIGLLRSTRQAIYGMLGGRSD